MSGRFIQLLIEVLFATTQHFYKELMVRIQMQGAFVDAILIVTIFEQSFETEERILFGPFAECFDKSDIMGFNAGECLNLFGLLQNTGSAFSSFVLL
ncbi:hypothetical protein [Sneathiella litorea]|uniref:Uncharacterized protein n=1 Tax=Sneathiella litorea TaxID=2606216 RepID=A0A6L8WAR9_9PROT|nr:hypothetical protein [Sneathiella litorea]MZR31573.1 hypothetical protein [Sneathiella litorea]